MILFDLFTDKSHPLGINGQNQIVVLTPIRFLHRTEFEKYQKSLDSRKALELFSSLPKIKSEVTAKKKKAHELKNKANTAFQNHDYDLAESLYSEALNLNMGSRPIWTNRAVCRNTMKKYEDAISDCANALSLNSKCTRSIIQKGNAFLGLSRFAEAKECFDLLRSLGEEQLADYNLKKLHDKQEMILIKNSSSK